MIVKNSFCSWDIYIFPPTFWLCGKNDLMNKLLLSSKFMTSQTGQQMTTIHILPNISRSKCNHATNVQLIKYSIENVFVQKLCRS